MSIFLWIIIIAVCVGVFFLSLTVGAILFRNNEKFSKSKTLTQWLVAATVGVFPIHLLSIAFISTAKKLPPHRLFLIAAAITAVITLFSTDGVNWILIKKILTIALLVGISIELLSLFTPTDEQRKQRFIKKRVAEEMKKYKD